MGQVFYQENSPKQPLRILRFDSHWCQFWWASPYIACYGLERAPRKWVVGLVPSD